MRCAFCNFWPGFDAESFLQKLDLADWQINSNSPGVVFESMFGPRGAGLKRWPRARQVWYTGENYGAPPLDEFDQCISFYRDIDDPRHLRFPLYHLQDWSDMRNSSATRHTAFIARNWNCRVRNEFAKGLMEHADVVCPGDVLNNSNENVPQNGKIDYLSNFRFNICFENVSTRKNEGYVTEKLADAIIAGCVPLYWGDHRVAEDFNTDLFVDLTHFGNDVTAMVDYVATKIFSGESCPLVPDAAERLEHCGYQKPDVRKFLETGYKEVFVVKLDVERVEPRVVACQHESAPELSICVAVKNRSRIEYEGQCLELFPQSVRSFANANSGALPVELVIADFGSDDWSVEQWLAEYANGLDYTLLEIPGPFSRGRGLNLAAEYARSRRLFLCDADILVNAEATDRAVQLIDAGQTWSPNFQLLNPDGSFGGWQDLGFGLFALSKELFQLAGGVPEFESWGGEDDALAERVSRWAPVYCERFAGCQHQWHPEHCRHEYYRRERQADWHEYYATNSTSEVEEELQRFVSECQGVVFNCVHPHWQGPVVLFENGRMARAGKREIMVLDTVQNSPRWGGSDYSSGTWEWVPGDRLVLNWDRWPAEKLFWNEADGRFENESGFIAVQLKTNVDDEPGFIKIQRRGDPYAGFASYIITTLETIAFARKLYPNKRPVIDLTPSDSMFFYRTSEGENVWDTYFQQPYHLVDASHAPIVAYRWEDPVPRLGPVELRHEFLSFVTPQTDLEAFANFLIAKRIPAGTDYDCVYYRGTDKRREHPPAEFSTYDDFLAQDTTVPMVIQTDQKSFLEYALAKRPDAIFFPELVVSENDEPVYMREAPGLDKGREAWTVIKVLAGARRLLASISNITTIVNCMRPKRAQAVFSNSDQKNLVLASEEKLISFNHSMSFTLQSETPLISCVMPTFGRPRYVNESISMFLSQDYPNKELIIVNDCPGQFFHCSLPGVRVINCENRFSSLGMKRNFCIEQAQGELIAIWDDDDVFLPWRLSFTLVELRKHQTHFYRAEEFLAYWGNDWLLDDLAIGSWVSHPNTLFTKELWASVAGYPEQNLGEDEIFFQKIYDYLGESHISYPIDANDRFMILRGKSEFEHMSMHGGHGPLNTTPGEYQLKPSPIADPLLRSHVRQQVSQRGGPVCPGVTGSSADYEFSQMCFEEKLKTFPHRCFRYWHSQWGGEGNIVLFDNGRMTCPRVDNGDWRLENQRLILDWDDWPAEILDWDSARDVYQNSETGFRVQEADSVEPI